MSRVYNILDYKSKIERLERGLTTSSEFKDHYLGVIRAFIKTLKDLDLEYEYTNSFESCYNRCIEALDSELIHHTKFVTDGVVTEIYSGEEFEFFFGGYLTK